MASKRLTNALRNTIINQLVSRTFIERVREQKRARGTWLSDYIDAWHAGHEKLLDQMPDRAKLNVLRREIVFREDGTRRYLSFEMDHPRGCFMDLPGDRSSAVDFMKHLSDLKAISPARLKHLEERLYKLRKNDEKLREEEQVARADAMAVLSSVNTYKALLEVWPELKEIIGDDEEPKPVKALVKNIGPLNSTFGLPTPRVATKPRSLLKPKK